LRVVGKMRGKERFDGVVFRFARDRCQMTAQRFGRLLCIFPSYPSRNDEAVTMAVEDDVARFAGERRGARWQAIRPHPGRTHDLSISTMPRSVMQDVPLALVESIKGHSVRRRS